MKKNLTVSIAIFINEINERGFKIWTQVREEPGALYGKLEFPGGKIEIGETPKEACVREVHEEVGVLLTQEDQLELFKIQEYSFENRNICLYSFISNFSKLPESKGQWLEITYADLSAHLQGRIPAINHVIIDELTRYIQKLYTHGSIEVLWRRQNQ